MVYVAVGFVLLVAVVAARQGYEGYWGLRSWADYTHGCWGHQYVPNGITGTRWHGRFSESKQETED